VISTMLFDLCFIVLCSVSIERISLLLLIMIMIMIIIIVIIINSQDSVYNISKYQDVRHVFFSKREYSERELVRDECVASISSRLPAPYYLVNFEREAAV